MPRVPLISSTQSPLPAERSEFVTVVAWLFIGLSGVMTLVCVAHGMMMWLGQMQELYDELSARFGFMFRYPRLLLGSVLLLWLITLVTSIGLLKRRNWARLVFIGLLTLGMIWTVTGPFAEVMVADANSILPPLPPDTPAGFRNLLESMIPIAKIFGVIYMLGFCLLYGWIIVRLMSAKVRSEFA